MNAYPSGYRFVVPIAKISLYLLNPDHPIGRFKYNVLSRYGFDKIDPHVLAMALLDHADPANFEKLSIVDGYTRFLFWGP